jgi:hypothetical protein
MSDSERDAELIALEQEISRLQSSINKSQARAVTRDSGLPESRRTTILDENYIGQGAKPKASRTTTLPETHIRPDIFTELNRTTDREQDRFFLTSTLYHANVSGRPENIAHINKRKVDMVKPDKFDGSTSWVNFKSHFEICAELNGWTLTEKGMYLFSCCFAGSSTECSWKSADRGQM